MGQESEEIKRWTAKRKSALERYLEKHLARLQSFGIAQYTAKRFHLNEALAEITRGVMAMRA